MDTACVDSPPPPSSWEEAPLPASPELAAFDAWLLPERDPRADKRREGVRTDGLVVVRGGRIVLERYGPGWSAEQPHLAWSVSKTVVNAAAGVAVREGLLSVDDSICRGREAPEASCAVKVRDVLSMGSGFDWRETYEGSPPTTSSVLAMLYGAEGADAFGFVAGHPLRAEPGTTWSYSSGDTNVAAAVVGDALASRYGERWPWAALFEPLGMTSAVWERDGSGTYLGSSYVWATPRDLARFGLLLLRDGCWGERRVLPEGWVGWSTEVAEGLRRDPRGREPGEVQGRSVWLNRPVPEIGQAERPWPAAPEDTFAALGHWKQSITVIPSLDLVIVRTGDDRDGSFRHGELLARVLAVLDGAPQPSVEPPPARPPAEAAEALPYDTGLLHLASAFAAKEACSCVFVAGRDEEACRAWVQVSPAVARFRVDEERRRVVAHALGVAREEAVWVDERTGCRLVRDR